MNEVELLTMIAILMAIIIPAVIIGSRLKLPMVIIYILTGVIIGYFGWFEQASIDTISELGLIFMMLFTGMEVTVKELRKLWKPIVIGGLIQMGIIMLIVGAIVLYFSGNIITAIFIGFTAAHSSTAIALAVYNSSGELKKPHGRTALGELLAQDISVIPFLLLIPIMALQMKGAEVSPELTTQAFINLGIGVATMVIVVAVGIYLVPKLLDKLHAKKNNELMTLAIIGITAGLITILHAAHIELCLAAFLVGVIIAGTNFVHTTMESLSTLQLLTSAIFFISAGLLLDLEFVWTNIAIVLVIVVCILAIKFIATYIAGRSCGDDHYTSSLTAFGLISVGEFSFVLASTGIITGIITQEVGALILAVTVITMIINPFCVRFAPNLLKHIAKKHINQNIEPINEKAFIIVGFGVTGKTISNVLNEENIKYVAIDNNIQSVKDCIQKGTCMVFGNATNKLTLKHAGIENALGLIITFPASASDIRGIVHAAHSVNPNLYIATRVKYAQDIPAIENLVNKVICDELNVAEAFAHGMKLAVQKENEKKE